MSVHSHVYNVSLEGEGALCRASFDAQTLKQEVFACFGQQS